MDNYLKQIRQTLSTKTKQEAVCVAGKTGVQTVRRGGSIYFARKINEGELGSLIELNRATDDEAIGVQNFQGNKLPYNKEILVTHVRLGYDSAPKGDNSKVEDVNYTKNFPAYIRNGEVSIKTTNDSKTVLEEVLSNFDTQTTGNNLDDKLFRLAVPFKIKGDETFLTSFRFPKEGTPPTGNDHFFKIQLVGYVTIS